MPRLPKEFVVVAALTYAGALAVSTHVLAQSEIDVLRERNISIQAAQVRFAEDGGCILMAIGVGIYDSGMTLTSSSDEYSYNGGRCGALRGDAKRAVNAAFRRGDGGVP